MEGKRRERLGERPRPLRAPCFQLPAPRFSPPLASSLPPSASSLKSTRSPLPAPRYLPPPSPSPLRVPHSPLLPSPLPAPCSALPAPRSSLPPTRYPLLAPRYFPPSCLALPLPSGLTRPGPTNCRRLPANHHPCFTLPEPPVAGASAIVIMAQPEARARQQIDAQLVAAGWTVQDYRSADCSVRPLLESPGGRLTKIPAIYAEENHHRRHGPNSDSSRTPLAVLR